MIFCAWSIGSQRPSTCQASLRTTTLVSPRTIAVHTIHRQPTSRAPRHLHGKGQDPHGLLPPVPFATGADGRAAAHDGSVAAEAVLERQAPAARLFLAESTRNHEEIMAVQKKWGVTYGDSFMIHGGSCTTRYCYYILLLSKIPITLKCKAFGSLALPSFQG